jgi:hypothetical protein
LTPKRPRQTWSTDGLVANEGAIDMDAKKIDAIDDGNAVNQKR